MTCGAALHTLQVLVLATMSETIRWKVIQQMTATQRAQVCMHPAAHLTGLVPSPCITVAIL